MSEVSLPDGGRLRYAEHGAPNRSPVPILLLRPLGGAMALWGPFAERLAGEFRVLAFDYRGMGESSAAPLRVTTRDLAADALGLLDQLGIARAHVFGISLGAMAATWLAHLAPERVARLCLASAAVRGRPLLGRDLGQTLRLAACFARRASQVEPCLVETILSARFKETHPAALLRILAQVSTNPTSPLSLLKHAAAAVGHDATSILGSLRAPTLVLAGGDDHLLGPDAVRTLADRIPGARFEAVAGVGHDLTLEDPAGVAARVGAFFSLSRGG